MSKLPPRTLLKLERLTKEERRIYAQELMGGYEYRRNHLKSIAIEQAHNWANAQAKHLDSVIAELRALVVD